jgi:hypothetical protein
MKTIYHVSGICSFDNFFDLISFNCFYNDKREETVDIFRGIILTPPRFFSTIHVMHSLGYLKPTNTCIISSFQLLTSSDSAASSGSAPFG